MWNDCWNMDREPQYRAGHTHEADQHGNISAHEGLDRCFCGAKYWENDQCVSCGASIQRVWIVQHAEGQRTLSGIKHQWAMDALGLQDGSVRDFDDEVDEPGTGRMVPVGDGFARIVVNA